MSSKPPATRSANLAMPSWASRPEAYRARRGARNFQAGLAAEDAVERIYRQRGARVLARRHRTPEGEIDLIVQDSRCLIFVEVKRRRRLHGFDSPISEKQWQRLGCAALHYVVNNYDVTRVQPICRFDAALVGADGQVTIIENARTFDRGS